MALSFAFDTSKGETAETLKRKRALADALLRPSSRMPSNVMEGLQSVGDALAGRILDSKLNAQEKAGQEEVGNLFTSAYGGGDTPSTPSVAADTVVSSAPKDGPKTASQALGGAPAGSPTELASTLIGKGEVPDRDTIKEYLANGGVNLDPATTAWCAAFVNATLGQTGGKGTGSNLARSFLNWGEAVDKPQKGDVAVFSRGNPNGPYGHVGFFEGYNPDGSIKVLGGNQGNAVSIASYAPNRLLGFRRAAVAQALAQQGAGNPQAPVQVASLDPSSGMGEDPLFQGSPVGATRTATPQQTANAQPTVAPAPMDWTDVPQLSAGAGIPFDNSQVPGGNQVAAALAQPQQAQAPVAPAPRLPGVSDALLRKNDQALGGILSGDNRQRVGAALSGYFPAAPSADGKPQGRGRPGEIRKGTDGQDYQYAETTGMAGDDGTGQGWIRVNNGGGQGTDYFPPVPSNVDPTQTASTSSGPNVQKLLAVINHPYATETQKALALNELKRIQDQSDPDKILDRRVKTAQLNAIEHPEAKAPTIETLYDENGNEYKGRWNPKTKSYDRVGGSKTNLLTPAELDQKIKLAEAQSTKINNNLGGGDNKQVFDAMDASATTARSAATGLNSLREAQKALDSGIISGAGADWNLALQKIGAGLGVVDPEKIQNTETFRSAIAPQVAALMKATVGSTQISNADREFAEKAAGGSINLDQGTIKRLLGIMEKAGRVAIKSHMDRLNKVYPEGGGFDRERALFGVDEPVAPDPNALPEGVTEEDIQETMRANNMTREQVLERLNGGS